MNSVFQWTRHRRFNNSTCEDLSFLIAADFSNLNCVTHFREPQFQQCNSKSTAITEIVIIDEITCVLNGEGIATAFGRATNDEIVKLNGSQHRVIRSIANNPMNNTLILVYHSRIFNNGLSISILDPKKIKKGDITPIQGARRLQELVIPYPGFIEFEENNGRIITSTAFDRRFHFWSMQNYEVLFHVDNQFYKELRVSKGTVAFFKQPINNNLEVRLCNIRNGEVTSDQKLELSPNRDLKFLELCGCYLLVKQEGACMRIHDLIDNTVEKISRSRDFCPKSVTFFLVSGNLEDLSRFASSDLLQDGVDRECDIKPSKSSTTFLAVHEDRFEVCIVNEGRLSTLTTIKASIPQSVSDCIQVVHAERLLLVYTKDHKAYFDLDNKQQKKQGESCYGTTLAREPAMTAVKRSSTQTVYQKPQLVANMSKGYSVNERIESAVPSKAALLEFCKSKIEAQNGLAGVSILDLVTGKRVGFVPLVCEDAGINVLVFDPIRREILAGGSCGFHRMISTSRTIIEEPPPDNDVNITELKKILAFQNIHQSRIPSHLTIGLFQPSFPLEEPNFPIPHYGTAFSFFAHSASHQSRPAKRRRCDLLATNNDNNYRYPKRQRKQSKRFIIPTIDPTTVNCARNRAVR